ncbi:uncharacterized protein M421DRAFT_214170 [Didymella exigua CBS 183.55]|uniref:Uncharacterized protein n=1 Tax=Didymella exigua CBS 183.55 TaxID=1150837 RepID=A0A6A5RFT3_9PLEO|nr:uncharacterized protein M421DRAFT_214170 [Didymella exigua CBS 183.55]KAF1926329.1 hypothetical protein M421DRAFT_214170 [Didymella exigua CBS 183.55]
MPQRHEWYPPALRPWNLIFTMVLCWTLIAILPYYLHRSQADEDIIFALDINDIPLSQTSLYRYQPNYPSGRDF